MENSTFWGGLPCTLQKSLPRQLRRVMRLTALLIFVGCLHVSASGYSQTVSFSGKDVPLAAVFASIEKQTGLSFFYNYSLMKETKPVTIDVIDVALEDALNIILKEQGLDFYRTGKTIFIISKKVVNRILSANGIDSPASAQLNVKGRVTNQLGEALVGASVSIIGGKKGAITDENGMFELKGVPVGTTLEISFLGYQRQHYRIEGPENLSVKLFESNNKLDEAQVIAYGSTTQRLSTGNVTSIKAADIDKQPVNNPLLALEGRVPGLFITQTTGLPGSGVKMIIQGQNSIQRGTDPFYVIDGVPYTSELLPNLGSMLGTSATLGLPGGQNGNPLSFINPADIESITILKDADATAIYGSRAANGAILITTKRGKIGKTTVELNAQQGVGQVGRKLSLLNTQQYLTMRHEAISNDGLTTLPTDYDINGVWDTTRYTDWQKALIGETAGYTNVSTGVSGGGENAQYLIGATYHRESTVFPGSSNDQVGSMHFNINTVSENQRFHLQFSGNYMFSNNLLPSGDLTGMALSLAPDAPKLYNADGSLNWMPNAAGTSTWTNPLAGLNAVYRNKTGNLISNLVLSYHLGEGLEFKSSFGYTNLQSNETVISPLTASKPENRVATARNARYGLNNINSWIIEPQFNYKKILGEGRLEFLLGTTIEQRNSNGQQILGLNYNSDQVLYDIKSASSLIVLSTTQAVYKYNALFGRLNYNLHDKYIVNLTMRRDGSSRFGIDNEFHNFGAAGVAWIFSQESFFQKHAPFINFGKLKASYGNTGNDQIGDYQFLNLYSAVTAGVPYQGTSGLAPTGLPNYNLQWEETKKAEIGIDLSILNDRVIFDLDYYHNRSSNQLLNYPLPSIAGFTSITTNLPATVQNTGWEFTLNTVNIKTKNFAWHTNFNLTLPKNELVAYPTLGGSSLASAYVIGQPITSIKTFHLLGVNPSTGQYFFEDFHGNVTSTPNASTDKTAIVNTAPTYFGGFENSFQYKGIEIDFLFQVTRQRGLNYFFGRAYPGYFNTNQPNYVLGRWQKQGDLVAIQRYTSTYGLSTQWNDAANLSDGAYTDASYIRLKNVSLSWNAPKTWTRGAHIEGLSVYLRAQNLLTITGYKGLDPETVSSTTLPPLRVITFGFRITL